MFNLKRRTLNSPRAIVLALLLLAVAGYVLAASAFDLWPMSSRQSAGTVGTTAESRSVPKKDLAEKQPGEAPADKTTDQVPVSPSLKASITQLEQSDSMIVFAAEITGSAKAGNCVITFSSDYDRPVVREVAASSKTPGTAVCAAKVSEREFSYLGEWKAELNYYENNSQAQATKNIRIE